MQILGSLVKGIIGLTMIVVVLAAGVGIYMFVGNSLQFGGGEEQQSVPVAFVINPGENVNDIAANLERQDIIDSAFWFGIQLRSSGKDILIKAGTFQLRTHMDNSEVIEVLTAPVADEPGVRFTVIEGFRLEEIAEKLGAQGLLTPTTFLEAATSPAGVAKYAGTFLQESGAPPTATLEGYLFPDTYEIKQNPGDNTDAVIKIMLDTMQQRITPEMREKLAAQGRTVHQMLTVASIVQREGVVREELSTIAAVYWNRVDQGMLLNADPTTQYAVGASPQWWPELTLDQLQVDHPYNTYKVVGLPPGPICAPGLAAIEAAVNPEATDYLYFVAKNDGSHTHVFARTLEEHERNRVLYGNR
ncbi:MAG: endolytic transglycosylase MltG [Chloroflexota bacterium]|nr:endolytic transglycosylase MltG [Chloroflexota bacterium]